MTQKLLVLVLLACLAPALPAQAASRSSSSSSSSSFSSNNKSSKSSESHSSSSVNQDDARDAVKRGKVMPLVTILGIVAKREPGTVLDAELETEDGVLTYKIDVLSDSGRTRRVRLNASSGDVIEIRDR